MNIIYGSMMLLGMWMIFYLYPESFGEDEIVEMIEGVLVSS